MIPQGAGSSCRTGSAGGTAETRRRRCPAMRHGRMEAARVPYPRALTRSSGFGLVLAGESRPSFRALVVTAGVVGAGAPQRAGDLVPTPIRRPRGHQCLAALDPIFVPVSGLVGGPSPVLHLRVVRCDSYTERAIKSCRAPGCNDLPPSRQHRPNRTRPAVGSRHRRPAGHRAPGQQSLTASRDSARFLHPTFIIYSSVFQRRFLFF